MILEKIIAAKKEELREIKKTTSISYLKDIINKIPEVRKFALALKKDLAGKNRIIAEVKKASPSKGDIRVDIDPGIYAKTYENAGACAVSVLTEHVYFKGSLKDLRLASNNVNIPVLRKDFIISSFQIYEAKAFGASSVLLINKLLEKNQLRDYIDIARQINMEPLVEIHSEWEIESILNGKAKIIGINNRNLENFETDTEVSKKIAPQLPKNTILVEASGISSPIDIQKGMESKIYNFLVGESIVKAKNPENFIRTLINTDIKS